MSIATIDEKLGRELMNQYCFHMKQGLTKALLLDKNRNVTVFTETFTQDMLIDFVYDNMIQLLMSQISNCNTLIEILTRI